LLVTVQSDPVETPAEPEHSIDLSELGPLSTASLLCSILLWQGARTTRAARALRERLLEMDQRMDEEPGSVEDSELAELKADLLRADAISEEQDEAFRMLFEAETDALNFSMLKSSMSLLTSSANATRRLNDRVSGAQLACGDLGDELRDDARAEAPVRLPNGTRFHATGRGQRHLVLAQTRLVRLTPQPMSASCTGLGSTRQMSRQ
jgi:hypothetical protein